MAINALNPYKGPFLDLNQKADEFISATYGTIGTDEKACQDILTTVAAYGAQDPFERAVAKKLFLPPKSSIVSSILNEECSGVCLARLKDIFYRAETAKTLSGTAYFLSGVADALDLSSGESKVYFAGGILLCSAAPVIGTVLSGACLAYGGYKLVRSGYQFLQAKNTSLAKAALYDMGNGSAWMMLSLPGVRRGFPKFWKGTVSEKSTPLLNNVRPLRPLPQPVSTVSRIVPVENSPTRPAMIARSGNTALAYASEIKPISYLRAVAEPEATPPTLAASQNLPALGVQAAVATSVTSTATPALAMPPADFADASEAPTMAVKVDPVARLRMLFAKFGVTQVSDAFLEHLWEHFAQHHRMRGKDPEKLLEDQENIGRLIGQTLAERFNNRVPGLLDLIRYDLRDNPIWAALSKLLSEDPELKMDTSIQETMDFLRELFPILETLHGSEESQEIVSGFWMGIGISIGYVPYFEQLLTMIEGLCVQKFPRLHLAIQVYHLSEDCREKLKSLKGIASWNKPEAVLSDERVYYKSVLDGIRRILTNLRKLREAHSAEANFIDRIFWMRFRRDYPTDEQIETVQTFFATLSFLRDSSL